MMILQYPLGELRIVTLLFNRVGHDVQALWIERIHILRNARIEAEHVSEPLGIFRATTAMELFQEEPCGGTALGVTVRSKFGDRLVQPVPRAFCNLGKPRIK